MDEKDFSTHSQAVKMRLKSLEEHLELLKSWKLPIPWEITIIKPELHFYIAGQLDPIIVPFTEDPEGALGEIVSAGFLDAKKTSKLIFVTHGFDNDLRTPWVPQMKDEILKAESKALVVLLGWGGGADISLLKYAQAAANTQTVAKWLIEYLRTIRKFVSKEIYVWGIAHSLGAHLLGLAGRGSGAFDRITALDPAGPGFEKVNQENRLCKTDANIVDVIHTDGYDRYFDPADWFAPVNHYGTLIPLGTIDFYPNFGYRQPGISHFTIAGSHHRSIELFIWSIANSGRFITNSVLDGTPAFESPVEKVKFIEEKVEMGFNYNPNLEHKGYFYLETNHAEPWKDEPKDCASWGWNYCSIS